MTPAERSYNGRDAAQQPAVSEVRSWRSTDTLASSRAVPHRHVELPPQTSRPQGSRRVEEEPETSTSPARPVRLSAGIRFGDDGRFELIKLLGAGGTSWVFQARDHWLNRLVVAKFLRPDEDVSEEDLYARLTAEARIVAGLDHENIVRVLDVGFWRGHPYMLLEHLEGAALSEMVAFEPMSALRATQIMVEVARALEHLHRAGVIHLDLKPHNVLVPNRGSIRLLDFGISATRTSPGETPVRFCRTPTSFAGTPSYMAPEQWLMTGVDERTDLWAAGALYYEMLTGAPPFTASDAADLRQAVLGQDGCPRTDSGAALPAVVDAVVDRLLRRDPADRFQSAGDLLRCLERAAQSLACEKPHPPARAKKTESSSPSFRTVSSPARKRTS